MCEIAEQVRKATNYSDLPHRIIQFNPFFQRPLISYGVVAYCPSTNRFLLVQRNNSPEFINYIRGSYRNSDLLRMVQGFSNAEADLAIQLIAGVISLPILYRQVIGDQYTTEEGYRYAQQRYQDSKLLMEKLLPQYQYQVENEWLLPKGRLSPGETGERCAQREFFEEAGIRLSSKHKLVSRKPLIESYRGENGRTYETRCWVYIFPQEIEPPTVTDPTDEIGNRRWMTLEEAEKVLRPSKYKLLLEAKQMTKEYVSWSDEDR